MSPFPIRCQSTRDTPLTSSSHVRSTSHTASARTHCRNTACHRHRISPRQYPPASVPARVRRDLGHEGYEKMPRRTRGEPRVLCVMHHESFLNMVWFQRWIIQLWCRCWLSASRLMKLSYAQCAEKFAGLAYYSFGLDHTEKFLRRRSRDRIMIACLYIGR